MAKSIYLIAGAITVLVFVSIFLFVKMDEASKFGAMSNEIMALYEEQQSNKIIEYYIGESNEKACAAYEAQIARQLNRIYDLFSKLEMLENSTFATSSRDVKRQYLLTSMSLWIDLENAGKKCSVKIKPILYFFPERWVKGQPQSCVECDAMVQQLEIIKEQCSNIRVFAFPAESSEFEFVELLKGDYGVSSAPAIVINRQVFYSIAPTAELKELLGC